MTYTFLDVNPHHPTIGKLTNVATCDECGALVLKDDESKHYEWHFPPEKEPTKKLRTARTTEE